eukprot:Gb_22874 [translate_table: standard]
MDNHKVRAGMLLDMVLIVSALCVGTGCLVDESQALVRFRASLHDRKGYLSSWLNGTDCCKWRGVECHGETGHVSKVDIHGFNLSTLRGRIDSSLFALQHLTHLDLSSNAFNGIQLPHQWGLLRQLKYLNMSNAGFKGTVPPQLGNLSGLRYLNLSSNNISGKIPYSIGKLSSLQYLDLSGNTLSGEIPSSLFHLELSGNRLKGTIPSSLDSLVNLTYLDLHSNRLNGTIPSSLANLFALHYLDLSDNQLQGSIPHSFGKLSSLTILRLFDNQLSGSLPLSIGQLSSLKSVTMHSMRVCHRPSTWLVLFNRFGSPTITLAERLQKYSLRT